MSDQQPGNAEQDTIDFLQALVRTCSYNPPGDEQAVAESVVERACAWGLSAELVPLSERRSNVLVSLPAETEGPLLLLCGHLDTVPPGDQPWEHSPLSGDLVGGVLHGRGTVDMKGGVVAMLAAMRALAPSAGRLGGRVRLVGLVGEEVDCFGAKAFLASGGMDDVDWMVVGEPTNLDVVVAHRGALWLEVTAHGRTAHGSMPHLGVNAIDGLIDLLRALRDLRFDYTPHPLLAPPTVNVGTIGGGIKTNVVPDRASATLDVRTLPGQRHTELIDAVLSIASEVEEARPGLRIEVRVAHDLPPVETASNSPLVHSFVDVVSNVRSQSPAVRGVSYYTDASVLLYPQHDGGSGSRGAADRVPTVIFGPGDDRLCHQPDERIDVDQVLTAVRCYTALARALLSRP